MRATEWLNKAWLAAVTCAALSIASPAQAASCLTGGSDVVGDAVFGMTVNTFVGLGIDPSVTCIENSLWSSPSGFTLGDYVKGAEGFGFGYDPTSLGAYNGAGSLASNANDLDFYWVQDVSANANLNGIVGSGPSNGIIWDLGGQANQAAVFVFVDHGPLPGEVLENTAWFSNDPNATDGGWTQGLLTHVYGYGWSPSPNIADGMVAVYTLPNDATFRYVSVTWGGPGAITRDGDNEIDAVGGLTAEGQGVGGSAPEPASLLLLGSGLAGLAMRRRRHA